MSLDKIGMRIPEICLPSPETDLQRWAVVACDQYTSQRDYWDTADGFVGDAPSTLRLIFPEVFLEDDDREQRIKNITTKMNTYLKEGIIKPQPTGLIYIERETAHGSLRKGLMTALDLEDYDYLPGAQTLIRATEGTVLERIPARVRIREGACLELPHIMVLLDDPDKTVIEPLKDCMAFSHPLYDFPLMKNSGHLRGFTIKEDDAIKKIVTALERLADPDTFRQKYGLDSKSGVLLYAVGDGNHSLAAAKDFWQQLKVSLSLEEQKDHPARYALVELVNVHDEGLVFEPIHRVLFHIHPDQVLSSANDYFSGRGLSISIEYQRTLYEMESQYQSLQKAGNGHSIPFIHASGQGILHIADPDFNLPAGSLQAFIDAYLKAEPQAIVDYIHGEDVVMTLAVKDGNMGFILPPMAKEDLFKTVLFDGVLPRKTFSMGEADEKRFYMECRKITR